MARQSARTGAEQVVDPNSRQVTLEHVLPQDIPQSWLSFFSHDVDPADYVYRIGNLTLLTAKMNRDASDALFAEKRRSALDVSQLPINKLFRHSDQWGNTQIEQRQDNLAKTALEVWKL